MMGASVCVGGEGVGRVMGASAHPMSVRHSVLLSERPPHLSSLFLPPDSPPHTHTSKKSSVGSASSNVMARAPSPPVGVPPSSAAS